MTQSRPVSLPPELLSLAQIAAMMGLSTATVERLRAAGRMPPPDVQLSLRTLRWRRQTIMAWIDARCPDAATWMKLSTRR